MFSTATWLRTYAAALVAALCVAAVDFWGLLEGSDVRSALGLGWRLALIALSAAAVVAVLLTAIGHASLGLVRRSRRPALWTVAYLAVGAFWIVHVSVELFSGGSMRRLPGRSVAIAIVMLGLFVGLHACCLAARRLRRSLRSRWRAATATALAVVGVALIGAVNRSVLPGLYDYLHTTLAGASFLLVFVTTYGWLKPRPRWLLAVGGAVTALAVPGALYGLSDGYALRAAMHGPRAPATRSVLAWVGGAIPAPDAPIVWTRRSAQLRSDDDELPSWTRPHVLLVTIDALRADRLGAYGYNRDLSPSIDELAENGVVFERTYTQAPHSSYALASLMASEYVHETVALGEEPPYATLPRVLRHAGYHTVGLYPDGVFHTHGERLGRYRDTEFGLAAADHRWLDAEDKTDAALAQIDHVRSMGEPPTLLWVHYFDVHEPYRETSLGTGLVDRYDGEVRNVDRALGRLVREARQRLSRDVVIVITADHGEELRDHGGLYHGSSLYEEQVRVPLVVNAPDLAPRRVSSPVELVDLAPTLLGAVGISAPRSMRGDDLRPLMAGGDIALAPAMSSVGEQHSVVDGHWKLIANLREAVFELYDLTRDPGERQNLADVRPEVLARLHGELRAWLASLTSDHSSRVQRAIEMAQLGDGTAAPVLTSALGERGVSSRVRVQAVRALGTLRSPDATRGLLGVLRDPQRDVALEAAVALGRLGERRARPALRRLLQGEEERGRVALALAHLGDRAAVPALIEVLTHSQDRRAREQAALWLGRLRDRRGFEPLRSALEVRRVRRYAAEALGRLGDPRASASLLELLESGEHVSVRVGAMLGLARLAAPQSAQALARLAVDAPEVLGTTEALVRVGALRNGAVGGLDFTRRVGGALRCRVNRSPWDERFVGRTTCDVTGVFTAMLPRPTFSDDGYVMFLRGRAVDGPTRIEVQLNGRTVGSVELLPQWMEHRFDVSARAGFAREISVRIPDGEVAELDHALLVPRDPRAHRQPDQTATRDGG